MIKATSISVMRTIFGIIALLLIGVFLPFTVTASGFYIQTIGSMDVQGSAYPQYWYSTPNPTITGMAPASSTITVTVDGVQGTTTADATGLWSYAVTAAEGDHSVDLATDAATSYSFTLTIGEMTEGTGGSITAPDTPAAGVGAPTIILLTLGAFALMLPFVFKRFIVQ
jgi:hypothetical protein